MTPEETNENLRFARCATCTQLAQKWYAEAWIGSVEKNGDVFIPAETPEANAAKVAYREHRRGHERKV